MRPTGHTCELWLTTADLAETPRRQSFPGRCGSLPSIGNVDGDGLWDVVLVAGDRPRALSTGIGAELSLGLPRGDLQATGVLPATRDSLDSYAARLPQRNVLAETGHTVLVMAIDPAAVERAVQVRFKEMVDVMRAQGAEEEARTFRPLVMSRRW